MGGTPVYHESPTPSWDPSTGYPPGAVKTELGKRIQARMLAIGWNQSQLGRHAGIGRDSISSYIRGRSMPGPLHLQRLAETLKCSVDDLAPGLSAQTSARPGTDAAAEIPLEIRQVGDGRVWLRLSRSVTLDQAARILAVINDG